MEIDLDVTPLMPKTLAWLKGEGRMLEQIGGTRSGKTWAILQALIVFGLEHPGTTIDIYRAEQAVARRTVAEDLVEILQEMGIYDPEAHHQTDAVYTLQGGSQLRLRGTDQSRKLRGAKRQILYLNEVNEIPRKAWTQLKVRTSEKVIADYNPSFDLSQHWISEEERTTIKSTYEDNKFLSDIQVEAIEDLIPVYREQDGTVIKDEDLTYTGDGMLIKGDPSDWSIYGRAEYQRSPLLLIPHYRVDHHANVQEPDAYGVDFGWTAPSAIVSIQHSPIDGENDEVIAEELLYETELTTQQLIRRMDDLDVRKDVPMFCDSAEPDRIHQIAEAGYQAQKAKKDLQAGLDSLRAVQLTVSGQNFESEISSYQRKSRHSDTPRPSADHLIDAARYGWHSLMMEEQDNISGVFDALNGPGSSSPFAYNLNVK